MGIRDSVTVGRCGLGMFMTMVMISFDAVQAKMQHIVGGPKYVRNRNHGKQGGRCRILDR